MKLQKKKVESANATSPQLFLPFHVNKGFPPAVVGRGKSLVLNSMANLRSREGILGGRSGMGNSGEIQLRIDPMHADLDDEITGLHQKIRQLKGVALEIEGEAKFQNDFLAKLQMTVIKAQAGLKNNMRRMNSSIIRQGSNHVLHVVLFALFCFFLVYLWTKYSRR